MAYQSRQRFRSACACLHVASPLKADKLSEAIPRQPGRDEDASGGSLTNVAAMSSPCSRSAASRGIGIAAVGESLVLSAACTWTSSPAEGLPDGANWLEDLPAGLARERTTSPLHIGHVRRRVVSQGVLRSKRSDQIHRESWGSCLHALRVEFMTTRQSHNLALPINILFQTNHAFNLLPVV